VPRPPKEVLKGARGATIEDVAASAGVSMATVSRALRGLSNVAPDTRARVEAAAAALQYRPDPNAARLAAGNSRAIGVAVPFLGAWYFSQVLAGTEAVLAPAGYDLLVYAAAEPGDRRRFLSDALPVRKRVDGLVLVDIHLPPDDADAWAASGVCVVTIGQRTESFPSVLIDNRTAAATAVRHLVELGHREIALIDSADDRFHFTVPELRRQGCQDALHEAGLSLRPEHVAHGRFTVDSGREAMEALLDAPVRPTAVFACSDEMAIGALQAARTRGLQVPGDVSVVGFDDHDLSSAIGLTTIRQPVADIGAQAASLLLAELAAGEPTRDHAVMPTDLVVRGSTGPA
jgi:LacI family transcriptional regulator, repressor for deo operon, udp, cdd, tsx, nupC, and nupG